MSLSGGGSIGDGVAEVQQRKGTDGVENDQMGERKVDLTGENERTRKMQIGAQPSEK